MKFLFCTILTIEQSNEDCVIAFLKSNLPFCLICQISRHFIVKSVIFKNCISFGPNFPNQKDMCHQTNEFISIENLMLSCKIYAKAIYELSK